MRSLTETGQTVNKFFRTIGIELKRPPYIFPSHEYHPTKCFFDLIYTVPHVFLNWFITKVDWSPGVYEAINAYKPKGENLLQKAVREYKYLGRCTEFDLASRAANGLRKSVLTSGGFGEIYGLAMEKPQNAHHAHPHARRLEKELRLAVPYIPEVHIDDWKALSAAGLFPYFHDLDQLAMVALRDEFDLKIDTKKGHALGGATMLMVLIPEYAKARHVPEKEAREIIGMAVLMCLPHDNPDRVKKILAATGDASDPKYTEEKDGMVNGQLRKDYENGEINLATLSPHQILMLLQDTKGETVESFNSQSQNLKMRYGLHPLFETEHAEKIEEMLKDHRPLFKSGEFGKRSRRATNNLTMLCVLHDQHDMIAPFPESVMRMFTVQASKRRGYFVGRADEIIDSLNDDGNISDASDSDVRRKLWELCHLDDLVRGTELENSPFITNQIADLAVSGVLHLEEMSKKLMSGDTGIIAQTFNRRILNIGLKVLRRIGADPAVVRELSQRDYRESNIYVTVKLFKNLVVKYGRKADLIWFDGISKNLTEELKVTQKSFKDKPPHSYSSDEIEECGKACAEVLWMLKQKYGVSDDFIIKHREMIRAGQVLPRAVSSYDSSSEYPAMKTFVGP